MKLGLSLFILATVWFVVTVWDAATLSWAPRAIWYFVDIPQLLYVVLGALAVTTIVHTWRVVVSGVLLALGLAAEAKKDELVLGARALQFLGQVALWSGVAVTLIESAISAHNSASLAGFLPALGVSLLGLLYGVGMRVACALGVQIIKVRLGPFVYYSE